METIADLNAHAQVANASLFFRRYTFLEFLAKIGTGLILLAPTCKCDASNKISLDVAFPSHEIGCIKCDETSTSKLGLNYA